MNKPQYFDGTDWQTFSESFNIGQVYGGGIIFYIDGTGQHGLIAAPSDQSNSAPWGCYGTYIGTSTSIGSGRDNTNAIVGNCATAGIAARICIDLVFNGYSDWFLPSKDELKQMLIKSDAIGNFAYTSYWSSSENSENTAWLQSFSIGYDVIKSKSGLYAVRAIRAF
jgi:hypothetical protein